MSSDRSADRILLRDGPREEATTGSKARRKPDGLGWWEGRGTLARQKTIEGAAHGEQTAILIDDLSLNPPESPAGGVAACSLTWSPTPSTRVCRARGGGSPPRKTAEIRRTRESVVRSVRAWARLGFLSRNAESNGAPVEPKRPVGTRGEIDLRVGGCRIIINWPLSESRGPRGYSSLFLPVRPYAAPSTQPPRSSL